MKMQPSTWCEIKNKEQWELFKSLNRDAVFYGSSRESMDRDVEKGAVTTAHCMSCGEIAYRDGGIGRNAGLTHLKEYKLPDCGPIPEGWRLVDKDKDAFRKDAKCWLVHSKIWDTTVNVVHYSAINEYIIPQSDPKPAWLDEFVIGTCIKVTKDNLEYLKSCIGDMKWNDGSKFKDWQSRRIETDGFYFLKRASGTSGFLAGPDTEGLKEISISLTTPKTDSAQQDKPAWVEKFVPGTFIKVTKDNVDEVAKHLSHMKWCNEKAFSEYRPSYWPECRLFNTAGTLTHSNPDWSSNLHKTEVFVGNQPKHEYKVGDKVVVTKIGGNGDLTAYWTCYEVGDVAEVIAIRENSTTKVIDVRKIGGSGSQGLTTTQVRPATPQDLLAETAKAVSKGLAEMVQKKVVEEAPAVEKKHDLSFSDVVKKVNPEFYFDTGKLLDPKITFTAAPGLGKAIYTPIGMTMHATESIPAGTLVSYVPTSTSEKEEKMLTQSERDDVIRIAVEAATAASKAKSGPGVTSKATGLATTAVKGLAGWALAPAKPVGRLAIKLLQYGVFLVGVVGGGSYLAYWTYNNGKDYLPTIEFKKPEDKSPKDTVMNSVTHFATTGEITG